MPIVCALSILFISLPVSAFASFDLSRDTDSVSKWTSLFQNASPNTAFFNAIPNWVGVSLPDVMWGKVNEAISGSGGVGAVNEAMLNNILAQYKNFFNKGLRDSFCKEIAEWPEAYKNSFFFELMGLKVPVYDIQERPSGVLAIKDTANDVWVVNSSGEYPYVEKRSNGTSIDGDGNLLSQWIGLGTVSNNISSKPVNMLSYSTLSALNALLIERGINCRLGDLGNYKAIMRGREVYCDADGRPYVCWDNEDQSATNQERPDTVVKDEDGNIIQIEGDLSDNSTNIDLSGMTITLPDGKVLIADNILYDESTKTYNIDSHDVTNNYITYNYSWTYHINYTSITYIGQTEEYNKYYEVYYELPDGRDSADLTKEEIEQLNVSIDVIPYGRSADDTSLRSLYHFDGDTKDSSYWNYCTDFTWNKGASLTYMESGTFEGCLYLDETEHDFTLTLPSSIGSGDFTLQFRYYQSYTAAPKTDSYIKLGATKLLQFNGSSFLNGSGTSLASTPIGTWNEVALIRSNGVVYYYLNGLKLSSVSSSAIFNNMITFHFGSSQQTYKQIDELRVLNYALASGGSYTCTKVPFDTNLTLVLPDSSTPIADEYYDINFDSKADFTYNLTDNRQLNSSDLRFSSQISSEDGLYLVDESNVSSDAYHNYLNHDEAYNYSSWGGVDLYNSYTANKWYHVSFSVIGSDNHIYSISGVVFGRGSNPSSLYKLTGTDGNGKYTLIPGGAIQLTGNECRIYIDPDVGTLFIRGIQICVEQCASQAAAYDYAASFENSLSIEHITSIVGIDTATLNTPTLAVRTDLDITSYQIGGVRPSLPTKGQVWALVENERITSIQIYNGSAWEGCDGRIWTGQRWVPASSYNIITLQDMYDIVDATPNYEYIYTESGFWAWWQKAWIAFTDNLFTVLGSGSGGSGGSGGDGSTVIKDVDLDADIEVVNPDDEDGKTFWQFVLLVIDGGKSVVVGVRHLFSGVVSLVPESMDLISGSFDSGGIAVGVVDGTASDPDVADMPAAYSNESEVLDPWRYR